MLSFQPIHPWRASLLERKRGLHGEGFFCGRQIGASTTGFIALVSMFISDLSEESASGLLGSVGFDAANSCSAFPTEHTLFRGLAPGRSRRDFAPQSHGGGDGFAKLRGAGFALEGFEVLI